ncbi:sterile alpha motif domain-containing protein 9-like [Betta splendens]|uniref:Sterile alpha motif domain-containing protein 9-like n=1 Tax=Betta splendens TaxID=158456 RepID=A0A6P7N6C8_BETSP|nr:sterile alpha motif domain-containing protein 9-like [Betta splendens]
MANTSEQSPWNWDENQVSTWLKSIGVKEQYIEKLHEEEVDGPSLLSLDENFLKTKICMKSGPAHLIIQKRDELLNTLKKTQDKKKPVSSKETELEPKSAKLKTDQKEGDQNVCEDKKATREQCSSSLKEDCRARPFDQDGVDFIYETHRVLQPESGAFDLISPCHEFKSFAVAARLDCTRLQAKFAKEVLKFATGCINIRSNGTIHFGVMDSKEEREGCRYVHGEIVGIPVNDKDIYVDALDYIEKSVSTDAEDVRRCVRPPRFIEVLDRESTEKRYVVEVDIVPSISIVKNKVYDVCLPNFKESANKVEREKKTIFRRVGSKTEPVTDKDLIDFYQRVIDRDAQREEAEQRQFLRNPEICQDLGRKLKMLITSGKKCIEKEKWFILVTNRFQPDDLSSIDWLLNMNLFCVFDFDPDSKVSGLCSKYLEHRAANMHFLDNYKISSDTSIKEFTTNLHLFDQTSWIFCNGRSEYKGNEPPCDEMTWIKTKMSILRECVSLICKQILPPGTFQVIFLLTSPVEKPLLHTFNAFFADMEGHENIISFCESQNNFQKWQTFAEGTCEKEAVSNFSVVGMKMSHMNATLQQIQPVKACVKKHLPVFMKGTCFLEMHKEEQMYTLEIVTADHCDETTSEFIDENKENIEGQFYHGGRVAWLNFWLAENKHVGEVIERDAYHEVSKLLNDAQKHNAEQTSVHIINIYHHPGSGGSTVARQVLWNNRKDLRCAVVKTSYKPAAVAQHAVELREYEEKDAQSCVPVLLLIEDLDGDYLDDLKYELQEAINMKKIPYETLCFILLSCRRSHDPEKKCKESPLRNVAVTHKLSDKEKTKFAGKQQVLEKQYEPQFILTFVLMSKEFSVDYVQQFVTHVLQGIDHDSVVTCLIKYVALLNTYVQNSFISRSHCEAFLTLSIRVAMFREQAFRSALSDQAQVVFLHLRDEQTHIDSIRIIHPLVAKEILKQLLGDQQTQSSLANDLLCEDALFEHRFGRWEYLSFLRALFIRRAKKSKGDEYDSLFSPLIEHVRDREGPNKAIELLKEAFKRFHENQFFAQQLARLHYTYEKFEEAKYWAEEAVNRQPNNSYLLDTKGQVYRKWFQAKCKAIDKVPKTAENTADAVGTAIKALECFQECERAADTEMDAVNSSGYFSEVEVGFSLLKLISSLQMFANGGIGHAECMKYLVTDYIPAEVKDAWEPYHGRLKELHKAMQDALEWISEDLSLFQTDIVDQDETHASTEEMMGHPLKWLAKKYSDYGKYFSEAESSALQRGQLSLANLTPFQKRMIICHYGGGNITAILSKLMEQKNAVDVLEKILSFYPANPIKAKFPQKDIVNYIMTNIALNNLSPQSKKLARLKDVQALCLQFPADKRRCLPSALFLLTVLFWPEDHDTDLEKETKYQTVQSAVEHLERGYRTKLKDIPQRKRRLYTHFFLGRGNGLDKFVHKKKFENVTKGISVSEKRLKWFSGEAWKMPEIDAMLKSVSGWTEDRVVYLEGPRKKRFSILPLNVSSVPDNENITFYLGFTFRGPVACNITITK